MKNYAVVIINDNGGIGCHQVRARSPMHSFYVLAERLSWPFEAVVAMTMQDFKFMIKNKSIEFPGEGVVSSDTILEQADVFNHKGRKGNAL